MGLGQTGRDIKPLCGDTAVTCQTRQPCVLACLRFMKECLILPQSVQPSLLDEFVQIDITVNTKLCLKHIYN